MQLDVALLELKLICDEAILCLSFACLFVPHGSHMHLRDQKAHMQMRLQDVFDKKESDSNAMDAGRVTRQFLFALFTISLPL